VLRTSTSITIPQGVSVTFSSLLETDKITKKKKKKRKKGKGCFEGRVRMHAMRKEGTQRESIVDETGRERKSLLKVCESNPLRRAKGEEPSFRDFQPKPLVILGECGGSAD